MGGSGIAAKRLTTDTGLDLLENALATAAVLPVLILMFGPISSAHFNPLISVSDWLLGRRSGTGLRRRELAWYLPAQAAGAIGGALLANAMFGIGAGLATHTRSGGHVWLGEVVATAGLRLVIVSLARSGKTDQTPWAFGAYIGAAYWFTSSTSFANPAVTAGRMFSDTFAGISPASAPGFVVAQFVGAGLSLALIAALYPTVDQIAEDCIPHARAQQDDRVGTAS